MGSCLQIIDIYDGNQWNQKYISAMRMMEQIVNGYFTDTDDETKDILCSLIDYILAPTFMECVSDLSKALCTYLEDEEYDTDSLLIYEDIEITQSSNILKHVSISRITDIIGMFISML